jgi:hypothetical protein
MVSLVETHRACCVERVGTYGWRGILGTLECPHRPGQTLGGAALEKPKVAQGARQLQAQFGITTFQRPRQCRAQVVMLIP